MKTKQTARMTTLEAAAIDPLPNTSQLRYEALVKRAQDQAYKDRVQEVLDETTSNKFIENTFV
jgi:hypothetical protein